MKVEKYPGNRPGFYMERRVSRDGPPVVYVVYYKNSSRLFTDPEHIRSFLKPELEWRCTARWQQLEEFLGHVPGNGIAP